VLCRRGFVGVAWRLGFGWRPIQEVSPDCGLFERGKGLRLPAFACLGLLH